MDDRIVMAEATRWLWRVLKSPTAEERSQAAAHLLTLFDEQYASQPGDSLFAALAERFGLPAVPSSTCLGEAAGQPDDEDVPGHVRPLHSHASGHPSEQHAHPHGGQPHWHGRLDAAGSDCGDPCSGCGARCQPSGDGQADKVAHAENCPWLAAQGGPDSILPPVDVTDQ